MLVTGRKLPHRDSDFWRIFAMTRVSVCGQNGIDVDYSNIGKPFLSRPRRFEKVC